jgi:hypothetical protein
MHGKAEHTHLVTILWRSESSPSFVFVRADLHQCLRRAVVSPAETDNVLGFCVAPSETKCEIVGLASRVDEEADLETRGHRF